MEIAGRQVELVRKNIKRMHLYVLPPNGEIKITAPVRMSLKSIEDFVVSKQDWIDKQQIRLKSASRTLPVEFVSGENVLLWGREYTLKVTEGGRSNTVTVDEETIVLNVRCGTKQEGRERAFVKWTKDLLTEELAALIEIWQKKIGVCLEDFAVRDMKTRWGSCNINEKRILFNSRLVCVPKECVESVVVHELCHLRVSDHSAKFKALMDRYYPDWKLVKKTLSHYASR